MINCHLSSISDRFRDTASRSRKPSHPTSSPQIEGPPSNFVIKLGRQRVNALGYIFSVICMILTAAVLSQYTRVTDDRQTTYYDNSRTLHCNGRLKTNNSGLIAVISVQKVRQHVFCAPSTMFRHLVYLHERNWPFKLLGFKVLVEFLINADTATWLHDILLSSA